MSANESLRGPHDYGLTGDGGWPIGFHRRMGWTDVSEVSSFQQRAVDDASASVASQGPEGRGERRTEPAPQDRLDC